jgi:hypothetical protein
LHTSKHLPHIKAETNRIEVSELTARLLPTFSRCIGWDLAQYAFSNPAEQFFADPGEPARGAQLAHDLRLPVPHHGAVVSIAHQPTPEPLAQWTGGGSARCRPARYRSVHCGCIVGHVRANRSSGVETGNARAGAADPVSYHRNRVDLHQHAVESKPFDANQGCRGGRHRLAVHRLVHRPDKGVQRRPGQPNDVDR